MLIVEATESGGGSTLANGGKIYLGGTALQKKLGIEDSTEAMYDYLINAAGDNASPDVIRTLCESAPEIYEWCIGLGMEFPEMAETEGHGSGHAGIGLHYTGNERARRFASVTPAVPRGHAANPEYSGMSFFRPLKAAVEAAGIEVLYNTSAMKLVFDDSGQVVGVLAAGKGGEEAVKARKGVVLTCGGFGMNEEMVRAYYPHTTKRGAPLATPNEDGSGILMGIAAGAETYGMGIFQTGLQFPVDTLRKGILVNRAGSRIVAEDEYYSFVGTAVVKGESSEHYLILDSVLYDELQAGIADGTIDEKTASRLPEPVASSESIADLASQIGVASENLPLTVESYNTTAKQGVDAAYGKEAALVQPIDQPPFYAFYYGSDTCYVGSLGGLKIDLDAQVLDTEHAVIPGLYAAGRTSGLTYGMYMASGTSMLDCFVFGRRAGRNAAARA